MELSCEFRTPRTGWDRTEKRGCVWGRPWMKLDEVRVKRSLFFYLRQSLEENFSFFFSLFTAVAEHNKYSIGTFLQR